MPIVCGVKFRGVGKQYYFSPGDVEDIQVGDHVIVETSRGRELGEVTMAPTEVDDSEVVGDLKPILHRATLVELLEAQRYRQREAEAIESCREQAARLDLPMKIVGAEYNCDGSRLTFFFASEQRVDFRELVRELARLFKTRIELRQIGVRDESKLLGGLGRCGRPLCCATWLTDFAPVSIRMAKAQDLPLSPMEISGVCGRLLCCLRYEDDFYREVKAKFPKVGKVLNTPDGPGKIVKVCALKETVTVLLGNGTTLEVTADQISGDSVTIAPPKPMDARRRALDAVLGNAASTPESPSAGQSKGQANDGAAPSSREAKPRRKRRRPAAQGPEDDAEATPTTASRRAKLPRSRAKKAQPNEVQAPARQGEKSTATRRPRRRRRSRRQRPIGHDAG